MKYFRKILVVLVTLTYSVTNGYASGDPEYSVYQYSVIVGGRTAYCWIPPKAKQVRGVILSLACLLERRWLEDPIIRKTAEKEALAIIWIGPVTPGNSEPDLISFEMEEGAGDALQKMLSDLSKESGYEELAWSPLLPMGHSDSGPFCWKVAGWNPARTIAVIPVKTVPFPIALKFQGVPICYLQGERRESPLYPSENAQVNSDNRDSFWTVVRQSALLLRAANENNLVSVVTDPGGGHFDWSEKQARFLALFISKACAYRLPVSMPYYGMTTLKRISRNAGWLTDVGGMDPDEFEPAPYLEYKGDPKKAYWFFDREMAMAARSFNGDRKKRKQQTLTFLQDGKPLPVDEKGFASLSFRPTGHSLQFDVQAGLRSGAAEGVNGSDRTVEHAPGKISLSVCGGPLVQTGEKSFRLQADRGGMHMPVWITAAHPGNDEYRTTVEPATMIIPPRLSDGKPQRISFPFRQVYNFKTKKIPLHASSSSGLPVSYYVVSGPAYVKGNQLILTRIPAWSAFPLKITVVAYQWGSMKEPLYQSAPPAIALYYINSKNDWVEHPTRDQIIIDLLLTFLLRSRL